VGPDREVRRFVRAAFQRLEAAAVLFREEYYLDAIYLAGYGPECALKALILSRRPGRKRAEFIRDHFRSRKAHSYDYLKMLLHRRGVLIPPEIVECLEIVNDWDTDLRYEVSLGDELEADEFLGAARRIVMWVERSL
jgi:HEPN domain-containing protein